MLACLLTTKKIIFLIAILFVAGLISSRAQNVNNSLNFDGADDRVLLNLNINPAVHPVLTFEAWVYRTGTTGEVNAIISNDNGDYDRALEVRADQRYHIHAGRDINTGITSNLNTWEHVAVTWSSGNITFIKNGVTVFSTGGETITAGTANTGLGNAPPFDYPFQGSIDEARIWNLARTQAEIQANMYVTICDNANGLVAYYPLNQGIAGGTNTGLTTAVDITSNNHDGPLLNFALSGATSNWVEGVPGLRDSLKFYKDDDGDKYGNVSVSVSAPACEPPAGYVLDSSDCNDKNAAIHPGACDAENSDGVDNNCDGKIDDGYGATTYYSDIDSDGYGAGTGTSQCSDPGAGHSTNNKDCNDNNKAINPGALEIIGDGIDNNCNGLVDEKLNNALNFDGKDDRVLLDLDINPAAHPVLTFEAWVYRTGTTGEVNAIISNDNGDYDRALEVRADQRYHIHAGRDINTGITSNLNTWEHVAVTWSSGNITFIKNGVTVFSTGGETITAGAANTGLGNAPPFDYPFQGNIDEARIWNVVRTKAEIQANMYISLTGNEAGLVAYYPFNQGIAGGNNAGITTLDDITPNNNDGTLNGFALNGKKSNWVKGVYYCPTPTRLRVPKISDTCARLNWSVPDSSVEHIKVSYRPLGTSTWIHDRKKALENSKVICGLKPNTTYEWKVRNICADDKTGWVKGPNFTTLLPAGFVSNAIAGNSIKGNSNINTQIIPNPNKGNFTVQMHLPGNKAFTTLSLYNSPGEKVWQQGAGRLSGSASINIALENKLSPGLYVLIVQHGNERIMQKVVVMK